ncbi:MAG: hypothetical protein DRI24_11930 [Deltaproteobacteria bacterium]|nr:MAG: hypothetical protein DRI24_11930 [Deltaproteobacteria bacterium]
MGYTPNHKIYDKWGRITPNVEHSRSERPHFESTPAAWLPVQRFDKTFEHYIVISSGKVVGEDTQGRLVPAGLRKAFNVASGSDALSYTALDVAEGVIDVTTGAPVAAAVTYTQTQLTTALQGRGLIRPTEQAMDFISKPVGIASYNYYMAFGSDHFNPAELTEHNFQLQATVAITCDWVITVPVLPAVATTEIMDNAMVDTALTIGTAGWFSSTAIALLVKYSSTVTAGDDIVAYTMAKFPIAKITADSPITASVAGLTRQVGSIGDVTAAGDFFIDFDMGILFLFESGGDAIPSPFSTAATLTYYHYEDVVGVTDARNKTFVQTTGDVGPGDFLTYDENSNLIKAALDIANAEGYDASGGIFSADPEFDTEADNSVITTQLEQAIDNHLMGIVGQVIGAEEYPEDLLELVRTPFAGMSPKTAAPYLQGPLHVPGSATGGRTDQLTYAGAAEKMLIVNLIFR